MLSPCKNFYNLIIKQENLSTELGFLKKHLKMNITNSISEVYHTSETVHLKLQETLDFYLGPVKIEIRKKLFDYLETDLQIFNYTWDYVSNNLTI